MAYTKQAWVDNVTPVDAARMLHLEDGVEMQVDVDSVVPSAGQLVASKLLAADANPALKVTGDGMIQWGAGGASALDTNLYRSSAANLTTNASLWLGGSIVVQGDLIYFHNTLDTVIARDGAGALRTDGTFKINGAGGLFFGASADTNLYRESANVLRASTHLVADQQVQSYRSLFGQISLGTSDQSGTGAPTIRFGSAGDTNLYRSAANTLKTDGALISANDVQSRAGSAYQMKIGYIDGPNLAGVGFGAGGVPDTNLYRSAAGKLRTDGQLSVYGDLYFDDAGFGARMYFGSAHDTNLYRQSAGSLKTDGSLSVGGQIFPGSYIQWLAGGYTLLSSNSGDTANRFTLAADGKHEWGPGNAALDTNLYRSAAGTLRFNGPYFAISHNNGAVYFGAADDTSLYRASANRLKTDGQLVFNVIGARVRRTSATSFSNGALVAIPWEQENFDTDNMWTASDPVNMTVQTTGTYLINVMIRFSINGGGTARNTIVTVDGLRIIDYVSSPSNVMAVEHNISTVYPIAAGQKVAVGVFQDSGSLLTTDISGGAAFPSFSMVRIG